MNTPSKLRIAIIGPGMMSIPPKGWGAVETIIWNLYNELASRGHDVVIFNTQDLHQAAREINAGLFDFIHLQYDEYIHHFLKTLTKPFCVTSHYGYIMKQDRWSRGYYALFVDFLQAPGIIALAPEIASLYENHGYAGRLYTLRNGVVDSTFTLTQAGNGKALCLGKIEARKRQAELARMVEGVIEVDFVGPLADPTFTPGNTTRYKGVWNRADVATHLSEYSVLVLMSDGEAAPLVTVEALTAGVSLVVSESAAANLDRSKPFISVIPDTAPQEVLVHALQTQVQQNARYRSEIQTYGQELFGMRTITTDYLKIISDFMEHGRPSAYKVPRSLRYHMSRIWRTLGQLRRKIKV